MMICIPFWCFLCALFPVEPAVAVWAMCTNSGFIWGGLGLTGSASACYVPFGFMVQRCIVDMLRLSETLKNFDMAKTLCRDENDKRVVVSRIVETWGSIDSFNTFVRGPVTKSIATAIGGC